MSQESNYTINVEALRHRYVGRLLHELEGPVAIVDAAIARRNCNLMLKAAELLDVGFRPHIKSHKTVELTRYQVGETSESIKLVVSTVAEIEQLIPFLHECKAAGRPIDIIYGLPVAPSYIPRLSALGKTLGQGSITVLVDCLETLPFLSRYHDTINQKLGVFVKIDNGYHRAGLSADSLQFSQLVAEIHRLECTEGKIELRGFYSHLGNSYNSDSCDEALEYLATELEGCTLATVVAGEIYGTGCRFICSVGATPTATSAQELLSSKPKSSAVVRVTEAIKRAKMHHDVELHAGAYVTLDMQQLAAHARISDLTFNDIALSVLTEVASIYNHRTPAPEALVACGKLSLGYDTCKSYDGMGVVMSWLDRSLHPSSLADAAASEPSHDIYNPDAEQRGWIVHQACQEHGMLRWMGPMEKMRPLQVGEKIRIIPNHCCMCLANFDFIIVIDSSAPGSAIERERVRDVWLSWGGW